MVERRDRVSVCGEIGLIKAISKGKGLVRLSLHLLARKKKRTGCWHLNVVGETV